MRRFISQKCAGDVLLTNRFVGESGGFVNFYTQSRSLMIPSETKIPDLDKINLSPVCNKRPWLIWG